MTVKMTKLALFLYISFSIFPLFLCRNHTLVLKEEKRQDIEITSFGFLKGGTLTVNISELGIPKPKDPSIKLPMVGFTLDVSRSFESANYAEDHANSHCVLKPGSVGKNDSVATVYLTFNFTDPLNIKLDVNRWGRRLENLRIVPMHEGKDVCASKAKDASETSPVKLDEQTLISTRRRRAEPDEESQSENIPGSKDKEEEPNDSLQTEDQKDGAKPEDTPAGNGDGESPNAPAAVNGDADADPQNQAPADPNPEAAPNPESAPNQTPAAKSKQPIRLPVTSQSKGDIMFFNTSFVVCVTDTQEEGLYSFFFHHCATDEKAHVQPVNLSLNIVEQNLGPNYLSAGDIPLPTLYSAMSVLFFCSAIYWIYYLCQQPVVFKIHYLMFFLALLKSLSLVFHAVDYHFIAQDGSPMQAFEILFYITYLTKGALMFGTIVLIGSGWAFIKPILSDNDKTLFWVVIPLQILANVAYIITDTSEEGDSQYYMWKVMFVTVDIICCGAILYPVIWSIRHLQEAAHTDGKAAISLIKLKLFRSYYVLVVCYIYFSRIVVYLLKVTMPFQFMWLDEFFFELATYVFYVVTAYKFRPGTDNPYLQLPSDDEDDEDLEMEEVVTETGLSEGMKRLQVNGTRAVQREANHSA